MTEPDEIVRWLDKRIASVTVWLEDHGHDAKKPWPEHVIEAKEYDLARFEEIRVAYVKAWESEKERDAAA